jgi:hypothetical protein
MPENLNTFSYFESLNQEVLLGLAATFIEQKNYFVALRLYDQYLYNYPKSQRKNSILENISKIFDLLSDSNDFKNKIQTYYDYNKASSQILDLIKNYAMIGDHNAKHAA